MKFEDWLLGIRERLLRRARWLCGRQANDAEDLVQGTFERILAEASKFATVENRDAWAHAILFNLFLDQLRRRKVRRAANDSVEILPLPRSASRPDSIVHSRDEVRRMLSTLPPKDRELLLGFEIQELSYKELAFRLGMAEGTVASRLSRIRHDLRVWLERSAEARPRGGRSK